MRLVGARGCVLDGNSTTVMSFPVGVENSTLTLLRERSKIHCVIAASFSAQLSVTTVGSSPSCAIASTRVPRTVSVRYVATCVPVYAYVEVEVLTTAP